MAEKILASQINSGTSKSWYARLKTLGSNFGASITTNVSVSSGNKVTADTMNTFITRLNSLEKNTYGAYASWSSNKPASVTQYKSIKEADTYTKINSMLTSLESLHAHCSTHSDYDNCGDNQTKGYGNCTQNSTYGQWAESDHTNTEDYTCFHETGNSIADKTGDCTHDTDCGNCDNWTCPNHGESNPNTGDYYYTEADMCDCSDNGDGCCGDHSDYSDWTNNGQTCTECEDTDEGHCVYSYYSQNCEDYGNIAHGVHTQTVDKTYNGNYSDDTDNTTHSVTN